MKSDLSLSTILDKITPEEEDYLSWVILFTWGCAMAIQSLLSHLFGGWASLIPWLIILAGLLGTIHNLRANRADTNGKGPHA